MTAKKRKVERLAALWPDIKALLWPRRWTLALGLGLVGVSRVAGVASPAAMKYLIDDVLGERRVELLPRLVLLVAGATLVQAGTGYVLTRVFSTSTVKLVAELRCKLHEHVLRLPLLYHDQSRTGDLTTRIMNDVVNLQNLVGTGMLDFAGSLATAALALAIMIRYSPLLAVVGLLGLFGFGALIARSTRRQKALGHERSDLFGDLMARLTEALGGIRVLKAYRAEPRERAIFAARIDRLVEVYLKSSRLSAATSLATTTVWGLVNAVVMFLGAQQILAGKLTLGSFFTFTVLLNYLVAPLFQILGISTMVIEALVSLERSRELLRERPEDQDPRRQTAIGALRGEVALEGVEFSYEPGKAVLRDISLRAAPGTVTALVGPSGAGKSTIIGLIASFYVPTAGAVLVDGTDLGTVRLDAYRSQLGVVLQETFLFAGSILDNIAFARPGATRDEILAAARAARVDEFAEKLAEGYDTLIGERGVRLSGGQRQRISIARSLLADPRILILDEATSSLDTNSEALIQEALAHLLEGRTTFVIAHRLSTIRRAHQILVVDGGRIVERGTHDTLVALGGLYAGMYRKQYRVETNLFVAAGEETRPIATGSLAIEATASIRSPGGCRCERRRLAEPLQIGGLVDVEGEPFAAVDADAEPRGLRPLQVAVEAVAHAEAGRQPVRRGEPERVGPLAAEIGRGDDGELGHPGDEVADVGDGEPREVRHQHQGCARAARAQLGEGGVDDGAERRLGRVAHRDGAARARQLGHVVAVGDDQHAVDLRAGGEHGEDVLEHRSGERRALRRAEDAGEARLGPRERLGRHQRPQGVRRGSPRGEPGAHGAIERAKASTSRARRRLSARLRMIVSHAWTATGSPARSPSSPRSTTRPASRLP